MQKVGVTRPLHHRPLQDDFVEATFAVDTAAIEGMLKSSGTGGVFVRLRHEQMGAAPKMELMWSDSLPEARARAAIVEKAGVEVYGITAGIAGYAFRVLAEKRPAALEALSAAAVPRMYSVRNVPQHVSATRLTEVLGEAMGWQVTDVVWSAQSRAWVVKAARAPMSFLPRVKGVSLAIEEVTGRSVQPSRQKVAVTMNQAVPTKGGASYAQMAGARMPPGRTPTGKPTVDFTARQTPPAQATPQTQHECLEQWMRDQEQRQKAWQERMERQQLRFQEVLLASVKALAGANQELEQRAQAVPEPKEECNTEQLRKSEMEADELRSEVLQLRQTNEQLRSQQQTLMEKVEEMTAVLEALRQGARDRDVGSRDEKRGKLGKKYDE